MTAFRPSGLRLAPGPHHLSTALQLKVPMSWIASSPSARPPQRPSHPTVLSLPPYAQTGPLAARPVRLASIRFPSQVWSHVASLCLSFPWTQTNRPL